MARTGRPVCEALRLAIDALAGGQRGAARSLERLVGSPDRIPGYFELAGCPRATAVVVLGSGLAGLVHNWSPLRLGRLPLNSPHPTALGWQLPRIDLMHDELNDALLRI